MSKLLKYKPEFTKPELASLEKAFKLFQDRNGISMDEYMDAFKEQTKLEQHQRVEEDEKAEALPEKTEE